MNPDLLEQRIGRLDRIGQQCDIDIHVPYLAQTAQQSLFEWYDQGLNLFRDSCSAGYMIFEMFQDRLLSELEQRTETFDTLLIDSAVFTARTRQELRDGRDKLLERNSCKPVIANALIDEIVAIEANNTLEPYLEALCETFGVEQEFHSEQTLVLRPSENMLIGHFPGLREDGTTITFNREKALMREDLEFLTWEHPMILGAMDIVQSTEIGNAALGTIKLKGVAPGTMLLELLYTVNCVAPRTLQLERFLPLNPMRLLVDARGKDLSDLVPHERLNQLIQKVKKATGLAIIKQVHAEVEAKMSLASAQAEKKLEEILIDAETTMRIDLG
ncbi:MAG: RNA polymerase-associated protein RapA, partial [Halioglobus sp.]